MDFKKQIVEGYEAASQLSPQSRAEYVMENLFGFSVYDDEMCKLLLYALLEVMRVIQNGETAGVLEDRDTYMAYLMFVNSGFMQKNIEWGTSVRFPWFNPQGIDVGDFKVPSKFVDELIEFLADWSFK